VTNCVHHNAREATRRAGPSATAGTGQLCGEVVSDQQALCRVAC